MPLIYSTKVSQDENYFCKQRIALQSIQKMFLEQISDISKLKECVKARYDIKELPDEIFLNC